MAQADVERLAAEICRKYGPEIADQYRKLCAEVHACSVRGDYAGMRAVVMKSRDLLKDVEAKRQQEQQQQQ